MSWFRLDYSITNLTVNRIWAFYLVGTGCLGYLRRWLKIGSGGSLGKTFFSSSWACGSPLAMKHLFVTYFTHVIVSLTKSCSSWIAFRSHWTFKHLQLLPCVRFSIAHSYLVRLWNNNMKMNFTMWPINWFNMKNSPGKWIRLWSVRTVQSNPGSNPSWSNGWLPRPGLLNSWG